jgi:hypothetical protein
MKKTIITVVFTGTLIFQSKAQSTIITPEDGIMGLYANQKMSIQTSSNSHGFEHTNGNISLATFISDNAAWLMTKTNHPLYFSTNNSQQASTPSVAILTNGNVGIGTNAPTEKLHVIGNARISGLGGNGQRLVRVNNNGVLSSSPQISYLNISRSSFLSVTGNSVGTNSSNGGIYCIGNTVGSLEAPINLPDGAVINNIAAYYADNGPKNVKVQLHRRAYTSSASTIIGIFSSTGASGNTDILNGNVNINADNVVDNNTYVYYIRISATILLNNNEIATTWGDGTTLTINQIKVTYSY